MYQGTKDIGVQVASIIHTLGHQKCEVERLKMITLNVKTKSSDTSNP